MTARSSTDLTIAAGNGLLSEFLATPPKGTPEEIVELLTLMAGDPGAPLPPRVYFEAVEQSPMSISITDPEANILYANHAFEASSFFTSRKLSAGQGPAFSTICLLST